MTLLDDKWLGRSIGFNFDDIFKSWDSGGNFPYHNIVKVNENSFDIELSLAGYSKEDVDISFQDNVLSISTVGVKDDREFYYRGITKKGFSRKFVLAKYHEIDSASMNNGVLSIRVVKNVPENAVKNIVIN